MRPRFGITLSEETLAEIDQRRGLIPRSYFIEGILKGFLEMKEEVKRAE